MKKYLLTILMMACAIVFVFSSCKKEEMEKNGSNSTSQDTLIRPNFAPGDGFIENAVTDIDGNTYRAVKLGTQVWMAENLRTTKYADGTSISFGISTSTTTAYRYYIHLDIDGVTVGSNVYNWPAVMHNSSSSSTNPSGVQGICPNGWHVPSNAEWMQLTDYVGSQSQYICGGNSEYIAKALASAAGWGEVTASDEYAPSYNPSSNNATGFAALPTGGAGGAAVVCGYFTYFWSSTECDSRSVCRGILQNQAFISSDTVAKYCSCSVRCVRD